MANLNGQKVNNASIKDIQSLINAGIDPKTGLPYRMVETGANLQCEINKSLRVMDEQEFVNRYQWKNLPGDLNSQMVERMLYYRGQLILLYIKTLGKFFLLPYALNGNIDLYGRFMTVNPIPYGGSTDKIETNGKEKTAWITQYKRSPIYNLEEEIDIETALDENCIILRDYTEQSSQTIIPRQQLQNSLLNFESEFFPLARTALIASSGVKGVRVGDEDAQDQVKLASRAITKAALTGDIWVPVVAALEFQELTEKAPLKAEEFLMSMQAVDNFRKSLYGIQNGGVFEKKAHELESEQAMNSSNSSLVYKDGLEQRKRFCEFANKFFGLSIQVSEAEEIKQQEPNEMEEMEEGGEDE